MIDYKNNCYYFLTTKKIFYILFIKIIFFRLKKYNLKNWSNFFIINKNTKPKD